MVRHIKDDPLNTGDAFYSAYYRVDDSPGYHYGTMICFHAFRAEGGLEVTIHKNGAHDEQMDEMFVPLEPDWSWHFSLKVLDIHFARYVEEAP